eukprot:111134-Chlamydomonas_euryale.AAC.2
MAPGWFGVARMCGGEGMGGMGSECGRYMNMAWHLAGTEQPGCTEARRTARHAAACCTCPGRTPISKRSDL